MPVHGFATLQSRLRRKFSAIETAVRNEVKSTGQDIQYDMISNASGIAFKDKSGGIVRLAGTISGGVFSDGYGYKIWVNAGAFAAYIEFGTGDQYRAYSGSLPAEWRQVASRYYVNGKGTLKASPYIYPAYVKYGGATFRERIRKAIKTAIR